MAYRLARRATAHRSSHRAHNSSRLGDARHRQASTQEPELSHRQGVATQPRFTAKPLIAALLALAAAAALAVGLPAFAGAAPSADPKPSSPPTIGSVQQQLAKLNIQNIQLVEQYNQAHIAVDAKQQAAAAAAQVASRAEAAFVAGRGQLGAAMTAQYESGSFSSTGALLTSQNGQNYLTQLQMLSMVSARNAELVTSLEKAQSQAEAAKAQATELLSQAQVKATQLAQQKITVAAQIKKYTGLLAQLNAQQRAAFLAAQDQQASAQQVAEAAAALRAQASNAASASNTPTASTTTPSSGSTAQATASASTSTTSSSAVAPQGGSSRALVAVQYALAQVGKWYEWGAAGPETFDCSGLTMRAWQAAGVSLPHSAADQYNYGTHVSMSDLQPGDLIFYYQPIGHVTIYIGNGLMVSAPETGEQVKVLPVTSMMASVTGATRLT